jgi:hypothetical protein
VFAALNISAMRYYRVDHILVMITKRSFSGNLSRTVEDFEAFYEEYLDESGCKMSARDVVLGLKKHLEGSCERSC